MINITTYKDKISKTKEQYSLIYKIIAAFSITYLAILFVISLTTMFTNNVFNWFYQKIDLWIYTGFILTALFISIETILYVIYKNKKSRCNDRKKPEYINGKKLHVFTYPRGAKGGIFSKTYIDIDEDNILLLRYLMNPPEETFKK